MIVTKRITRRKPLSDFFDPSLDPLINRLYANRGIKSGSELNYGLKNLPRPELLSGMPQACEILYEALIADASILIVGDYDVDGATSTCLVKQSLEAFGFNHVGYFIPDRMTFGYGLSAEVVKVIQEFQPDLVITVDNGISSHEGIKLAGEYGISVIVTDHHLPADTLPQADAIINPSLVGDVFPAKNLAGVGVAFYLMLGLRAFLRQLNWFVEQQITEPAMVDYLDLVALGTIADVVPFDYFNRLLVYQGMQRINRQQCSAGIKALTALSDRQIESVTTSDIAYVIAPKINAAGRLDDMSVGVECLLCEQPESAYRYAQQLVNINEQRKSEEDKSNRQAASQISSELASDSQLADRASICLYSEDWHPGIVGLIASRLRENFNLPSVIFADDHEFLKGSARSVSGVHIRDILAKIDAQNPGIIVKFGGHAKAAGLSIKRQNFQRFKELLEEYVSGQFSVKVQQANIVTDGPLSGPELVVDTCRMIQASGPWGHDFEEPLFDNTFDVVRCSEIGKQGRHLRFVLKVSGAEQEQPLNAVAFNVNRYLENSKVSANRINAVYRTDINRYNNLQNLQLIIDYFDIES